MSADTGIVRLDVRGAIGTVMFDRPSARNAMTWAMYEQLDTALDAIASNASLRVAVLRGAGGHFIAGTDIAQFTAFTSGDDGVEYERRLERVIAKLESMQVATIAAVEGSAMGGGLALATACDLRLCTTTARFGVPIARTVGNALSLANHARLAASLGVARTKALLFTADAMTADEARALGFVVDVVEPDRFDTALDTLSARVAEHAPVTLQVTKEALRRIVAMSATGDDDLVRRAYASDDFHEGVAAYLSKRTPRWEGR